MTSVPIFRKYFDLLGTQYRANSWVSQDKFCLLVLSSVSQFVYVWHILHCIIVLYSPYLDHIIVLFTEKCHTIELNSNSKIWVNFITYILCPTKLDIAGTTTDARFVILVDQAPLTFPFQILTAHFDNNGIKYQFWCWL